MTDVSCIKHFYISQALSFLVMFTYLCWYPNNFCTCCMFYMSTKSIISDTQLSFAFFRIQNKHVQAVVKVLAEELHSFLLCLKQYALAQISQQGKFYLQTMVFEPLHVPFHNTSFCQRWSQTIFHLIGKIGKLLEKVSMRE